MTNSPQSCSAVSEYLKIDDRTIRARKFASQIMQIVGECVSDKDGAWSRLIQASYDADAEIVANVAQAQPQCSAATGDDILLRALDRIRAGLSNDESVDYRGADPIADLKVLLADYDRLRAVPQEASKP